MCKEDLCINSNPCHAPINEFKKNPVDQLFTG